MAVSESSAQRYQLQDPDVRLMLEVRGDNAAAFDELMLRYQNRLVTVLEHLVGRRDHAEDLAQEVFLRVYRRAALRGGGQILDLAVYDRQSRGGQARAVAVAAAGSQSDGPAERIGKHERAGENGAGGQRGHAFAAARQGRAARRGPARRWPG